MELKREKIFDVGITNAKTNDILEYIDGLLQQKGSKHYIVTPNPEILIYANSHKSFRDILNNATISLADGVGVMMAGKILGKPLKERVTGVDLLEKICERYNEKPVKLGFLGAKPGIAELTVERLQKRYPNMIVTFIADEWSEEGFKNAKKYQVSSIKYQEKDIHNTKYKIHDTDVVDILFVAFGFPKQEQWMHDNSEKLPVKLMMGVGGAFDYLSGSVPRAPKILRLVGLEWLFRLVVQPWRIKRQLALVRFIWLVIKAKVTASTKDTT